MLSVINSMRSLGWASSSLAWVTRLGLQGMVWELV